MKALAEKLKSKGLKVTPQRLSIYNMLNQTVKHPSAETIHKALEPDNPSLSLATVYKTLIAFKEAGLIQAFNVGEESSRYDANSQPHPHIVCNGCHSVMDLPIAGQLESLRNELQAQTDFIILSEQLFFYGICKDCRKTRSL